MAISPQRLTICLYSAHRVVIFAITQLSCYKSNNTSEDETIELPRSRIPWPNASALTAPETVACVRCSLMLCIAYKDIRPNWRLYYSVDSYSELSAICLLKIDHIRLMQSVLIVEFGWSVSNYRSPPRFVCLLKDKDPSVCIPCNSY